MGSSSDPAKTKHYLSHAIEHYERGMYLDLNDYFPSSNLARLYRQRGRKGDAEKAVVAASVTEVACARARRRHASDPWLKPTLLAAAFDAGDVDTARELADDVEREGAAIWRLETALADIERSIAFFKDDPERFESLASVVDDLRTLLAPRRDPKFQ
jgi:tetratricopeptide (TPR) repeat protein